MSARIPGDELIAMLERAKDREVAPYDVPRLVGVYVGTLELIEEQWQNIALLGEQLRHRDAKLAELRTIIEGVN